MRVSAWASATWAKATKSPKGRGLRFAWGLFLVIGLPLGFMAALGPLAAAGIYVEPLRPFWRPWPPDLVRSFMGAASFAATLAYLSYRIGQSAGYRRGTAAATAAARNVAEGRISAPDQTAPLETPRL